MDREVGSCKLLLVKLETEVQRTAICLTLVVSVAWYQPLSIEHNCLVIIHVDVVILGLPESQLPVLVVFNSVMINQLDTSEQGEEIMTDLLCIFHELLDSNTSRIQIVNHDFFDHMLEILILVSINIFVREFFNGRIVADIKDVVPFGLEAKRVVGMFLGLISYIAVFKLDLFVRYFARFCANFSNKDNNKYDKDKS